MIGQRKNPEKWTPLRGRLGDIAQGHQTLQTPRFPLEHADEGPASDCNPHQGAPVGVFPDQSARGTDRLSSTDVLLAFSADRLLTLVHFNVFRGLLTNMLLLRLPNLFSCEVATKEPLLISALPLPSLLPPALYPTPLQQRIPHHPWIDLFPVSKVRDTLIQATGSFDSCELCIDVLGNMVEKNFDRSEAMMAYDTYEGTDRSMIVWGDPWNIASWEASEGFLLKWGWMFQGCREAILHPTNHWRSLRGEEPLM